jgi:hypothetical protein
MSSECFNDDFANQFIPCAQLLNVRRCFIVPESVNIEFGTASGTGVTISNTDINNTLSTQLYYENISLSCCPIGEFKINIEEVSASPSILLPGVIINDEGGTFGATFLLTGSPSIQITPSTFDLSTATFPTPFVIGFFFQIPPLSSITIASVQAICGDNPPPPPDNNVQVIQPFGCNNGRITVFNFQGMVELITPSGKPVSNQTGIFYVIQPGTYILTYFNQTSVTKQIIIKSNLRC